MPVPQRKNITMALTRRLFAAATLTLLLVTAASAESVRVTFLLVNDIYLMGDQVMPDGKRRGGFVDGLADGYRLLGARLLGGLAHEAFAAPPATAGCKRCDSASSRTPGPIRASERSSRASPR